jgi:hypothetical protein
MLTTWALVLQIYSGGVVIHGYPTEQDCRAAGTYYLAPGVSQQRPYCIPVGTVTPRLREGQ